MQLHATSLDIKALQNGSCFYFCFQERILKCGGAIFQNYIVGSSAVNNRLAMTRSIGDLCLKPFGVISQPDIREVNVSQ